MVGEGSLPVSHLASASPGIRAQLPVWVDQSIFLREFCFLLPLLLAYFVTSNEALMLGEEVTYEVGVSRARGSLGAPAAI